MRVAIALSVTALIAVSAYLGACAPAHAQDDPDIKAKAARQHFQDGIALYNRGEFERACREFEASLALFSGVGSRGKLAECYERIGRTASAWRLYREVLRLARDEARRTLARKRIADLEPRLARLTIEVGAASGLDGFTVARNGVAISAPSFGQPIIVDPGVYRIAAGARQYREFVANVKIAEGGAVTVEVPMLRPLGDRPGRRTTGLIVGGVGLALMLGGGGTFGLLARSQWQTAQQMGCDLAAGVCTETAGFEAYEQARRNATLANIAVGVGALTAVLGAYLWWRADTRRGAAPTAGIQPTITDDLIGVQLHRSF